MRNPNYWKSRLISPALLSLDPPTGVGAAAWRRVSWWVVGSICAGACRGRGRGAVGLSALVGVLRRA